MMTPEQLNAWMVKHFTRSAFRLETLQTYEVATDGSDFRRYLDGEPTWTPKRKQPWLDHLAAERARGLHRHRVRIVTHPVTPYTRYECEWGYVPNAEAGEDIRVLDVGERDRPDVGVLGNGDWWLVVDRHGVEHVVGMKYATATGEFVGAVEVPRTGVHAFSRARNVLWDAAEPFAGWWERHPELRRDGAFAA
jgi:hypothetical protein